MTSPPIGDPPTPAAYGASAERTRLAWRRTVLANTAVVVLTIRLAVRDHVTPFHALAIAVVIAGWLGQLWITQRRIHAMADPLPGAIGRTLPIVALQTAGYAVIGLVLALTG
jgi:uncharacterized membrane protein YidH (DUF202 family)